MASLTFAEAKVVAPPILPRKHPANHQQKLFPQSEQQEEEEENETCTNLKRPPLTGGA